MARASFYGSLGYHGDDSITRHLIGDALRLLGTVRLLCGVSYCPPRCDLRDRGQTEAGILARRCQMTLRRGPRRHGDSSVKNVQVVQARKSISVHLRGTDEASFWHLASKLIRQDE